MISAGLLSYTHHLSATGTYCLENMSASAAMPACCSFSSGSLVYRGLLFSATLLQEGLPSSAMREAWFRMGGRKTYIPAIYCTGGPHYCLVLYEQHSLYAVVGEPATRGRPVPFLLVVNISASTGDCMEESAMFSLFVLSVPSGLLPYR